MPSIANQHEEDINSSGEAQSIRDSLRIETEAQVNRNRQSAAWETMIQAQLQ
jgi:hypothetical protein